MDVESAILGQAASPLVSIVTPVLNGAATILDCIDSVRRQDHPVIEHLVIDGGSDDGTTEILTDHGARLSYWRSEPDRSTAEAFNKGLEKTRGDIVAFLNADDWYEPDTVSRAVAALETSGADFTYGSVNVHGEQGCVGVLHPLPPKTWAHENLYQMPVPHISMFIRRHALDRVGAFDERCRCTSDHDYFIRLCTAGYRGVAIEGVVGNVRSGGAADGLAALRESWAIAGRHGAPIGRRVFRFGRSLATYPLRKTVRRILGEARTAQLLAQLGSRHASA